MAGSEAWMRRRKPIPETYTIFVRAKVESYHYEIHRSEHLPTVHVSFLTNTFRGQFRLALLGVTLRSPSDSLLLFGKLATGLHVHQKVARPSSLVDKRFSAKAADRLPFALTKSPKRDATTQRSSSGTDTFSVSHLFPQCVSAGQAERSSRLSARFCCSLLSATTSLPLGRSSIIAYHMLQKCEVALHEHFCIFFLVTDFFNY